MTAESAKVKSSGYHGLIRLIRFAKPYQWECLSAFAILLLATVLEMLAPWLMKIILDEHIPRGLADTLAGNRSLLMLGGALLATYLGSAIFQYLQSIKFQIAALHIVHDIRRTIFAHVLKLPMHYFDSEPTGVLVSRITNDSEMLRQMFVSVIPAILQSGFRVVGICIAMTLLDVSLMFMTLLLVPIILLAIHIYQKISHPVVHGVRRQLANINTRINESLNGMRIVQATGQEARIQQQFDQENEQWRQLKHKNVNIDSLLLLPFTHLLNGIALAVVVGWFGYQAGYTVIEVGTMYAFINYLGRFFEPFRQITMQVRSLQQAIVASERIFQVLDESTDSSHQPDDKKRRIDSGKLEFRNVSLSYDSQNMALDDVSFTIEPGQFVAIVGHSGSGKSSIINLLMRFYQQKAGEILIDDQPLASFSENTLRQGIGLVFQEPYIFSGTMAENISLNHTQISDEQVQAAARKVHADPFIQNLAHGYQHKPGPGGKALSTGERQLLSFARTVAQNPKILLLDEATANIDGELEHRIKEALITLQENRTTIAVAHRLSTIVDADQILVMEKGKIVQRGTHEELIKLDGHYRDLYLAQQTAQQLQAAEPPHNSNNDVIATA